MRKIEDFLERYGVVLKIILVALWFFWAMQLFSPLKSAFWQEVSYQKNRDAEAERKATLELNRFIDQKIERAKKEETTYGPRRYFEDLKEITKKSNLSKISYPSYKVMLLQQLSWDNVRKGYYKQEEISGLASSYREWLESNISGREEALQGIREAGWGVVLSWLVSFYGRTAFLAFLFYLVRMAIRGSILGTILADKKKFILAVSGWAFFFHKYPFNVVREIRVEAELRKIKNLFRSLTAREARLVRTVASSGYYREWITEYRRENRGRFQRGLLLALTATLVLHMFFPSLAKAGDGPKERWAVVGVVEKSQDGNNQNLTNNTDEDDSQIEEWALPPEPGMEDPPLVVIRKDSRQEIYRPIIPDEIDHIPLSLFVFTMSVWIFLVNLAEKGNRNECQENINCSHWFADWNERNCFC